MKWTKPITELELRAITGYILDEKNKNKCKIIGEKENKYYMGGDGLRETLIEFEGTKGKEYVLISRVKGYIDDIIRIEEDEIEEFKKLWESDKLGFHGEIKKGKGR